MSKSYFPSRQAELIPWGANLSGKISATPTAFGTTSTAATALASANTAMASAYATAVNPATRTRMTIEQKNAAIKAFMAEARVVVKQVQGFPALSDAQRIDLGITVHAPVAPINPPTESPVVEIVAALGRTIKVKLHAIGSDRRSKPAGASGAAVFSFVGSAPPADINAWVFQGSTTRTVFNIVFPPTVAAGSQVFLTAFWFNPRSQSGPACTPISAYVAGGVSAVA